MREQGARSSSFRLTRLAIYFYLKQQIMSYSTSLSICEHT